MSYRPVIAKASNEKGIAYGKLESGDTFTDDENDGDERIRQKTDRIDGNKEVVSVRFSDGDAQSFEDEFIVYPCYVKFTRITKEEYDANA